MRMFLIIGAIAGIFCLAGCFEETEALKKSVEENSRKLEALEKENERQQAELRAEIGKAGEQIRLAREEAQAVKAQGAPPRWAVVDGGKIESAISKWNSEKNSGRRMGPTIPPEKAAKYAEYQVINQKLGRIRMEFLRKKQKQLAEINGPGSPYGGPSRGYTGVVDGEITDPEYAKLSDQLVPLRIELKDVLNQENTPMFETKYTKQALIKEYAEGKYDLVVEDGMGRNSIPYLADGKRVDITDAVIALFESKEDR